MIHEEHCPQHYGDNFQKWAAAQRDAPKDSKVISL